VLSAAHRLLSSSRVRGQRSPSLLVNHAFVTSPSTLRSSEPNAA
jgi:hypothetical protein